MRVCKCGGTIRQHPLTDSREAWTCNACGRYEVIQRSAPASEKHTPGPWKIEQDKAKTARFWLRGQTAYSGDGRLSGTGCIFLGSIGNGGEGDEAIKRAEANAHLISAAPELLEALKLCSAELFAKRADKAGSMKIVNKARAAIEKATDSPHPLLNFVDITGVPPTNTEVIVGMLKTAIKILENEDGSRAAWRIADAGLMMRGMLTKRKEKDVCGFDVPTEMGAILPSHDRA